jgi:EAL domain-containing protein (putative c-di-GMP-specific phosphodiesterase class I)
MIITMDLEWAAFFLSLFCLIYNIMRKRSSSQRGLYFRIMIIATMICPFVSEMASSVSMAVRMPFVRDFWAYFLLTIYFIVHMILPAVYGLYTMAMCGRLIGRKKMTIITALTPLIICEFLVFINFYTKKLYYLDNAGMYHRGPFMILYYLTGIYYVLFGITEIIINRSNISKRDYKSIIIFNIIAACGLTIQFLFQHASIELFAESIAILGLLLTCENEDLDLDSDTHLRNRQSFYDDNQLALATEANYSIIALSMPDIDRDESSVNRDNALDLIYEIANWLKDNSDGEAVYRLRVSDFAIVLTRHPGRAKKMAENIASRFEKPWQIGDMSYYVRVVISIAIIPDNAINLDEISSLFLFNRKDFSQSNVLIRNDKALNFVKRRSALETAIRNALDKDQMIIYYQPIVSTATERCVAAEALIRIDDPTLGMLSPEEFIPIAEQAGLIGDIGQFVFNDVCRFYNNYRPDNSGLQWIELNVSAFQLSNNQLFDGFYSSLTEYDVPVRFINLELTESEDSEGSPLYMDTIRKLYEMGFSFSIDDYGTGYSNIARLLTGYYENVKLDKTILWNSNTLAGMKILKELNSLLKDMKLTIIQEGVETKEQLELVKSMGTPLVQGFYYSKPIPEKEFMTFLKEFNKEK